MSKRLTEKDWDLITIAVEKSALWDNIAIAVALALMAIACFVGLHNG